MATLKFFGRTKSSKSTGEYALRAAAGGLRCLRQSNLSIGTMRGLRLPGFLPATLRFLRVTVTLSSLPRFTHHRAAEVPCVAWTVLPGAISHRGQSPRALFTAERGSREHAHAPEVIFPLSAAAAFFRASVRFWDNSRTERVFSRAAPRDLCGTTRVPLRR